MAAGVELIDFENKMAADEAVITMVGMSGLGKSHWSRILTRQMGFEWYEMDAAIEEDLDPQLKEQGFEGGINDVSRWMGQPYDERFASNEQSYLDLEIKKTEAIIKKLTKHGPDRNTVIDTTGSVVHTKPEICRRLGQVSTVVYIEAMPDDIGRMIKKYFADPKPVVWGGMFEQKAGEKNEDALARCYPKLLHHRSKLYGAMANLAIPYSELEYKPESAELFLGLMKDRMRV